LADREIAASAAFSRQLVDSKTSKAADAIGIFRGRWTEPDRFMVSLGLSFWDGARDKKAAKRQAENAC
jgi:hypothetical protein